jgi:hypothetical protein
LPPQPAEACRFADALKPLGISDNIKSGKSGARIDHRTVKTLLILAVRETFSG